MNKMTNLILIGILACLVIIAFKPNQQPQISTTVENKGLQTIFLGNNKVAIFYLDKGSGKYGDVNVYEIKDSELELLYTDNISDSLRN